MRRFILLLMIGGVLQSAAPAEPIRIGGKNFNEGSLLAEIIARLLEAHGFSVSSKMNLGGTLICFTALNNGEIDCYPEYSGTIAQQILKQPRLKSLEDINKQLQAKYNLQTGRSFGFNNSYALAVKNRVANQLHLENISDLQNYPDLRFAFSYEFLNRQDGWLNLATVYRLHQQAVGIEHGLAYQAVEEGKVDLIDVYSTDGEIPRFDLHLLHDDRDFFPRYEAVALFRASLPEKVKRIIGLLAGRIDERKMQHLNALAVFERQPHRQIARNFLIAENLIDENSERNGRSPMMMILHRTIEHLELTAVALLAAMMLALPLGIYIYYHPKRGRPLLYLAGLLQTIPSIALLAFMIPLFGIGVAPAIVALFLYALLPILRNTAIALFSVDPLLKKVATGMGLTRRQILRHIELPLAIPTILAGIRTAAVINIGTATLAAFIGAGGLGQFIVTGLSLNDVNLILQGAIPAALLAVIVEFLFEWFERMVVPAHLLQKRLIE